MATPTGASAGSVTEGTSHVLRVLVLPVAVALVAVVVAAFVGHLSVGLLVATGVGLGAANGLLMEQATAKLTPEANQTRKVIVKSSMGRLGLVSAVALLIAFLARPNGWVLLLGLACYQLLALLATIGAAAREARLG